MEWRNIFLIKLTTQSRRLNWAIKAEPHSAAQQSGVQGSESDPCRGETCRQQGLWGLAEIIHVNRLERWPGLLSTSARFIKCIQCGACWRVGSSGGRNWHVREHVIQGRLHTPGATEVGLKKWGGREKGEYGPCRRNTVSEWESVLCWGSLWVVW